MDLETIRIKKEELRNAILDLVSKYESDTTIKVEEIVIKRNHKVSQEENKPNYYAEKLVLKNPFM